MNEMTKAQKEYINTVILPTLVKMAIEDTLDSDMNILSSDDFEEATEAYNKANEATVKRNEQLTKLGCYLREDDLESALTRLENANDGDTLNDIVDMREACEDMGWMTVEKFFKDYL